jgi:hypothetical protein
MVITALLSCSCTTTAPEQPTTARVGGIELFSGSPETQLLLFVTPDDRERLCLAPPPDAVSSSSLGGGLTVDGTGISEESRRGAAVLGGRGPLELTSRELLYRACEFSMNYRLEKHEALELYEKTLATIREINATAQAGSAALSATPFPSPEPDETGEDEKSGS